MNRPGAHAFWLFGLSGAGKSTLAGLLAANLRAQGVAVLSLDGDALRAGLCRGVGFSDTDRSENLRRASEVVRLALESQVCVVAAFITPLQVHRQLVTELIGAERLSLIWIDAPLAVCQSRDVKGLYARAQAGQLTQMTGLTSGFEQPSACALTISTKVETPAVSGERLIAFARSRLSPPGKTLSLMPSHKPTH